MAERIEIVGSSKIVAAHYIVNVLARKPSGVAQNELNGTHCCDSIGGDEGIHSSSEQSSRVHTPAGIGILRERDKQECKSRKECGRHDHPGCSTLSYPIVSESHSRHVLIISE